MSAKLAGQTPHEGRRRILYQLFIPEKAFGLSHPQNGTILLSRTQGILNATATGIYDSRFTDGW
jgi:hypothetical protein